MSLASLMAYDMVGLRITGPSFLNAFNWRGTQDHLRPTANCEWRVNDRSLDKLVIHELRRCGSPVLLPLARRRLPSNQITTFPLILHHNGFKFRIHFANFSNCLSWPCYYFSFIANHIKIKELGFEEDDGSNGGQKAGLLGAKNTGRLFAA